MTMAYSRRGSNDEANYQSEARVLSVLIDAQYAGLLTVFRGGYAQFAYDPSYEGPNLSIRMPVGSGPFLDDVVRPWVEGLLPDNERVRVTMAKEASCSPHNPFDLLAHFGRDCPGAVQICAPEDIASTIAQEGAYEPITDREIGRRLRESKSLTEPVWVADNERWSLGGAQGKISLARMGGHWNSCHGSAATTHLLKPGVEGFPLQGLNEYLCMRLAAECGLQVAVASYEEFDGVPAIVIERYDREVTPSGQVVRLHQEDLCQALGFLPRDKYKPTPSDVLQLMRHDTTGQSTFDFVSALFFNYLIGATDAHAKNYSLMHLSQKDVFMAPLYDVASIFPYKKASSGARHAAMPIGREKRFGRLTGSNIDRFARNNALDEHGCRELMMRLAKLVLDCIDQVVHENEHIRGVAALGPELQRTITANCEAMLLNLDRDGHTCDTSMGSIIDSGSFERGV